MNTGRDYISLIAEGYTPTESGGVTALTPTFSVPSGELTDAIFIAPATGVPYNLDVTFAGTYAVGDEITVTILSNDRSVQKWRKAYRYVVPAGGTAVADIAAAIAAKIQADGESDAPYFASNAAGVVTVTSKNNDSAGLVGFASTNSSAGTAVAAAATGTKSEGEPQDLIDRGVPADQINLASYDTVRIVYEASVPFGDIDSSVPRVREIYWFGSPGEGAALVTLITT